MWSKTQYNTNALFVEDGSTPLIVVVDTIHKATSKNQLFVLTVVLVKQWLSYFDMKWSPCQKWLSFLLRDCLPHPTLLTHCLFLWQYDSALVIRNCYLTEQIAVCYGLYLVVPCTYRWSFLEVVASRCVNMELRVCDICQITSLVRLAQFCKWLNRFAEKGSLILSVGSSIYQVWSLDGIQRDRMKAGWLLPLACPVTDCFSPAMSPCVGTILWTEISTICAFNFGVRCYVTPTR